MTTEVFVELTESRCRVRCGTRKRELYVARSQFWRFVVDDDSAPPTQGSDRIKGAYAWRRYLEWVFLSCIFTFVVSDRSLPATRHGGRITLGSDFPVESIDPLKGFYAAVSRRSEDGKSPMGSDGW